MDPKRRQIMMLAALGVVLASVLVWQFLGSSDEARPASVTPGASRSSASGSQARTAGVPGVALDALKAEPPGPDEAGRDPFRFQPRRPPPSALPVAAARPPTAPGAGSSAQSPEDGGAPAAPPPPPPPPPITLKFVGVVQVIGKPKIAVLTDGRGVFYGTEGEAIEGRYRIVRIGAESIEMVYLDGRGRQVIRLSGS